MAGKKAKMYRGSATPSVEVGVKTNHYKGNSRKLPKGDKYRYTNG